MGDIRKLVPGRKLGLGLAVLLLAGLLTACDDGRAGAENAAKGLASSLASLDVGGLALEGKEPSAANEQLTTVFATLGPAKPQVSSGEIKLDGESATVPLEYQWKIGSAEWKYTVQASLKKSGDKWLTQWAPAILVPDLKDNEVLRLRTTPAKRGEILGAADAPIVVERPVLRIGMDKTLVSQEQAAGSAGLLAELVGLDPQAYSKQVVDSGPQAFVEAIVLRAFTGEITAERLAQIPGAVSIEDSMALAPTRTFARALLGSVGQASAEQVEKANGALKAGDSVGKGGLQEQYDAMLRGKDGLRIEAVSKDKPPAGAAPEARELFKTEPTPGTTLRTTLDPGLQQLAEDTLAKVGPASALVALRPSDGAVLAAASGPGSNGYNTAMLGQYAPGSTFKVVDSLALLRKGMTPDSKVECPQTVTVDGRTFKNAEGYPASSLGSVTLLDAFAHSCNTAFINARTTVSQGDLESAATSLGVAVEAPKLGTPAFLGSVPGTAQGTEHAASMIGQGKVLVSPLAAAVMAGSVAKGSPVSAQLVLNADGGGAPAAVAPSSPAATVSGEPAAPAAKTADTPVTREEAAALTEMMRAVVTSGHAGFLADVPGSPVTAKTGTAEFGRENPPKTHAWIIATHGDLAVAVFVEDGGLGATTSGPLLKSFLLAAG
jgi:cell division protein FtsI/penicillin-binding protein 2